MSFDIKVISDSTNEVAFQELYEKIKKLAYDFHRDNPGSTWMESKFKAEPAKEVGKRVPFDQLFKTRAQAEEIIEVLQAQIDAYGHASIGDLKSLIGVTLSHQDYRWGWKLLRTVGIRRVEGGYIIDYPPVISV